MNYKIGDKFIIQISEIYKTDPGNRYVGTEQQDKPVELYRIKGFGSLVLDENGLDKLEKYDSVANSTSIDIMLEQKYREGLNDAWEAAKKIAEIREEIGSVLTSEVFAEHTASEVISEIKAYEEQKKAEEEEIKVGDEIESFGQKSIVTGLSGYADTTISAITNTGYGVKYEPSDVKKTGRHFDIEGILKDMREE